MKTYGLLSATHIDEHGHPSTSFFDALGRPIRSSKTADGTTVVTQYSHDLLGRLTRITDTAANIWTWTFDSLGRVTRRNDPDSGLGTFGYDDAGRITSQTDARLQQATFDYDAVGRPWRRTPAAGETPSVLTYSQARPSFYNVGRLTSSEKGATRLDLDYDAAGRNVKQQRLLDGTTYALERRHDAAGRLTGITWPDGDVVGSMSSPWTYDLMGRLASIPGILTGVTYDAAGRPRVRTNANGTATTRTYSATRGFLTGIGTVGGSVLQDLAYTPDAAGMLGSVTSHIPEETATYEYDGFHRLRFDRDASQVVRNEYQYDTLGRMTYNSGIGSYVYPSAGQPRPHAPSAVGPDAMTYDGNGNLETGRGRTLAWTPDNKPSQIGGWSFEYGGTGERLKKTDGTSVTLYPFGDDYEIADGVITKYIAAPGLGVITKRVGSGGAATTFWLHTDRLGSIQPVTDAAGVEVLRRSYEAYGDKIQDSTSHAESRGYIEQRQDETGLLYLHARYYDPATGLFISPDPAGSAPNAFAYSGGDPINAKDPTGLCHDGYPITRYDEQGQPYTSWMCPTGDVHQPGNSDWLTGNPSQSEEEPSRVRERQEGIAERQAARLARLAGRLQTTVVIVVTPPCTGPECTPPGEGNGQGGGGEAGTADGEPPGVGYNDLNVSYGTPIFLGGTGGLVRDDQFNRCFYLGGGPMTPGPSVSFTGTTASISEGWNYGTQIGAGLVFQFGKGGGSKFFEVGGGTPGVSFTVYYVFGCF